MGKKFRIGKDQLVNLIKPMGGCIATDKITIDGEPVRYMYREKPDFEFDSGWRFFAGIEDQDYVDNPDNMKIYNVNTIANFDRSIIPYLHMPEGTELFKHGDQSFKETNPSEDD